MNHGRNCHMIVYISCDSVCKIGYSELVTSSAVAAAEEEDRLSVSTETVINIDMMSAVLYSTYQYHINYTSLTKQLTHVVNCKQEVNRTFHIIPSSSLPS